jgi:hypothetical protein
MTGCEDGPLCPRSGAIRQKNPRQRGKEMKRTIVIAFVAALVVSLVGVGFVANAESLPSSKAAAAVSELTLLTWEPEAPSETPPGEMDENIPDVDYEGSWTMILEQSIKTPNQKDLFIDVSLETGLYTRTLVRSKRNSADDEDWDTSRAKAEIRVRVLIDEDTADERTASPGSVVFDMRNQTLSAKFMGIFTADCFEVDPDTGEVTLIYECLEPEELDLILHTLAASSFNFVIDQLTPGVHTVSVQARIFANGSAEEGQYEAMAMVGRGSVVIEVVRMIQGADWLID